MSLTYREYSLNRTTVDEISGVVQNYMNELKVERSGVERTRLSVEEILLSLLDHYGEGIAISVGNYLPDTLRQSINDHVLSPLNDGFLGLLRTFSGLMIAFTICNGIIGMRDTSTFRRIGRSVLQRIILNSFVICLIMIPLILPFVNPIYSHVYKGESSAIGQISKMFFDIIPQNIVEPFITGNSLQIILIAVIVGVGLISIGERGGHIQILVNEVTILMQGIVSSICVLVPLFIFTILFTSLGIPLEAIVVAVTMDLIFDFFDTGFNILHLMLFTACTGKELETGRG